MTDGSVDRVLSILGIGRWQIEHVLWLTVYYVPWTIHLMSIVIIGFTPNFACVPNLDDTQTSNNTNSTVVTFGQECPWINTTSTSCDGEIVYSEPKHVSIVSEWDLICEKGYISDLSQTLCIVGLGIGNAVFSPLADKFGRRKIILWTHLGLLVVSLATCLVPNVTLFIVCRVVMGAFVTGSAVAQWVLLLETFIPKHRTIVALTTNVIYSVSACVLPGIGYLMKGLNWRYVQLAISTLSVCIVGQYFFVEESMRWLLANDRQKEAVKILQKACKLNNVNDKEKETMTKMCMGTKSTKSDTESDNERIRFPLLSKEPHDVEELCPFPSDVAAESYVTALDLFKHPKLRRITVIMLFVWFTNQLVYGGLYMIASVMPGDRYLNLFLSTVAEVAGALALIPLLLKFGRKSVCILLHFLGGASLISAIAIFFTSGQTANAIEICITIIGKFSISGTFNLIYLYTAELYPTNVRSAGLGVVHVASRVGGIIYPFAATLSRYVRWLSPTIFGALSLGAAGCSLLLPETANKEMPRTLADVDKLYISESETRKFTGDKKL